MEIEFSGGEEGDWSDLTMRLNTRSKLEVFPAEPGQIRIALSSQASHGEMGLEVGLSPDQARSVGYQLLALADDLEDDREE